MCEVSYPFAFNFNSVTFAVFGSIVIVLVFSKIYCEFPGCMGFTVAFKPLSFVKRGINRKDNFEINWVTRMPKKRYCVLRPKKKLSSLVSDCRRKNCHVDLRIPHLLATDIGRLVERDKKFWSKYYASRKASSCVSICWARCLVT